MSKKRFIYNFLSYGIISLLLTGSTYLFLLRDARSFVSGNVPALVFIYIFSILLLAAIGYICGRFLLLPCGSARGNAACVALAYVLFIFISAYLFCGKAEWYFKLFSIYCMFPPVAAWIGLHESIRKHPKKNFTWWRWAIPCVLLVAALWKGIRFILLFV